MQLPRNPHIGHAFLAAIYGAGVRLRNYCYNHHIFKSYTFSIPIICVGSLNVGGAGKTPMVEYLLRHLSSHYKVAVVSRGYKRKRKGMVIADATSTALDIGDEPLQIVKNFPNVLVAVDGNRKRVIEHLCALPVEEMPDLIIMDDGFQHRRVRARVNILLTDFAQPCYEDYLMPRGTLREPFSSRMRAHCVVVTKCPADITPMDKKIFERGLSLFKNQPIFFSSVRYGEATPLFTEENAALLNSEGLSAQELFAPQHKQVLMAGIAKPEPFFAAAKQLPIQSVVEYQFSDHHTFTKEDIELLSSAVARRLEANTQCILLTTQKDAMRLLAMEDALEPSFKSRIYYLPIESVLLDDGDELFAKFLHKTIKHPNSII